MQNKKLYDERECDELEPFFSDHMHAMTGEQLHGKGAIACELAYRDKENQALRDDITVLQAALLSAHTALKGFGLIYGAGGVQQEIESSADRIKINPRECLAEIEAAAVERFVKERFWNSACEVSACVAESGIQWAENRRKESRG